MFYLDQRNEGDGLDMLVALPDAYAKLVLFDPQYRAGLNHLSYGNEGARQKGRAELQAMSGPLIGAFEWEIERILTPSGYVMQWLDKFDLCTPPPISFLTGGMRKVDLVTWNKMKMGMGYRSRRQAEYLLVWQKPPIKAKATWRDHGIPDVWSEKIVERRHTHQKPSGLIQRLIEAVTDPGDLVVNPCAGSFCTMDVALACGRHFLGCDLKG
jgi:site-specific DNA-methyltransferase (adenine-specific)